MALSRTEEQVIRNTIARLRGQCKVGAEIDEGLALANHSFYLDTWVVGALQCLLPESRDPRLGASFSHPNLKDGFTFTVTPSGCAAVVKDA